MIDMVFLLLVFFMCVSTMAQADKKELNLPESEQSEVPDDLANRGIISLDAVGVIYVSSVAVELSEMKDRIGEALEVNPRLRIQVRADEATPYGEVKKVLKACAEVGAYEIVYATYQAK